MPSLSRKGNVTCIYWVSQENAPLLTDNEPISVSGFCSAGKYYNTSSVTCYNGGACNGSGTCIGCSAYDVGGLKFSHKDTTKLFTDSYLLTWDEEQQKYIPQRKLSASERTDAEAFSRSLLPTESTRSLNYNDVQVPMNLAVYNIRAKVKKCCNWIGTPISFSKDRNGSLYITFYVTKQMATRYGLREGFNTVAYSGAALLFPDLFCAIAGAADWRRPETAENNSSYPCNGCKPECPFYTGPSWKYCLDTKMETGDKISAAQVMELRYYSDDWKNMNDPHSVWEKRFKDPYIWAWTGEYVGKVVGDVITDVDVPLVSRVHIDNFKTEEPEILIDESIPVTAGVVVTGREVSFPTLIKQIGDVSMGISIAWPKSTAVEPFVFKTFKINQNVIRIIIDTPYITSLYAVNLTKHPQMGTDYEFIDDLLRLYPDDILTWTDEDTISGMPYFDIELEYGNNVENVNVIKVFTRDPYSSTGEYKTATCHVKHVFYHAMVAQVSGKDYEGYKRIQPWIDRFEHVKCEAEVFNLTGNVRMDQVLWDTFAGNKITMYPIEVDVIEEYIASNKWHTVGCDMIALEISNTGCNSVFPCRFSGVSVTGADVDYGVFLSRPGVVDNLKLTIVYRSGDGTYSPSNVVFAKLPAGMISLGSAIDEKIDAISVTYAYTQYKQCPIKPEDYHRLKYPNRRNDFLSFMPIEVNTGLYDTSFTVEGSFVEIKKVDGGQVVATEKFYNIDSIKDSISDNNKFNENRAVESFQAGGLNDDSVETSGSIFSTAEREFNSKYSSFVFSDDGTKVTLEKMCEHLSKLYLYEGAYKFLCVFNDESGRPIGLKRIYMMLQSATVDMRDVEIYYEWRMNRQWWPIYDLNFLLASLSYPPKPYEAIGEEIYEPGCGDHAEGVGAERLRRHFFGDPGPMWYPYNRCEEPVYNATGDDSAVKCSNYVEGFGSSFGNLRFSYWEKMRGPDVLRAVDDSPIFLTGCTWSRVEYTIQTINEQKFTGYTRIRSSHPLGPYAKDREAIHLNRHYIKRNLKVRSEIIQSEDNDLTINWSDPYNQIAFTADGAEKVGSVSETPIWVHLTDGISGVECTTDSAQHPFAHYLLKNVGPIEQNETYNSIRLPLKDVIKDRDLTTTVQRDTNGTLIYSPEEPDYIDSNENYSDLLPVFKNKDFCWAWLEKPKEIVRTEDTSSRITGITLYNPTTSIWKTNRESAVYTTEGIHALTYIAPIFDEITGQMISRPCVVWDDGPERIIDWYTGAWAASGTVYDYRKHNNVSSFSMFGKYSEANTSYFLADSSGIHKYVKDITVSGVEYGHTFRGVGTNPYVMVEDLPYTLSNYGGDRNIILPRSSSASVLDLEVRKLNNSFVPSGSTKTEFYLTGTFYIEDIKITYKYGYGNLSDAYVSTHGIIGSTAARFDIPPVRILVVDGSGTTTETSNISYIRAPDLTGVDLPKTLEDGSIIYLSDSSTYRTITYSVGLMCRGVSINFGSLKGDGYAYIEDLNIVYRRPEDRVELVTNYEQRVNVSVADSGEPDYRNLLYYYNRTYASYGDSLAFTASTDSTNPSVKFTSKSVKDVILEYEYSDITGTRFAYNEDIRPENNTLNSYDMYGVLSYQPEINVHTKSRTLVARSHVDDCPQWMSDGNANSEPVAGNENSSCGSSAGSGFNRAGDQVLNEDLQECLYNDAQSLALGNFETVYEWFWHPDEVLFWYSVGVDVSKFSTTLTLSSTLPKIKRFFEHESYGCSSSMAVPYYDGIVHKLPTWQGVGHIIYAGEPLFNDACWAVVVHKIGKHLGEITYGTENYGDISFGWPYEAPKDKASYIAKGLVDKKGTYYGGSIGGIFGGSEFAGQMGAQDYGGQAQSTTAAEEVEEQAATTRAKATRADASRRGIYQPE